MLKKVVDEKSVAAAAVGMLMLSCTAIAFQGGPGGGGEEEANVWTIEEPPANDQIVKTAAQVACSGDGLGGAQYTVRIDRGTTNLSSKQGETAFNDTTWGEDLPAPSGGWGTGAATVNLKHNNEVVATQNITFVEPT